MNLKPMSPLDPLLICDGCHQREWRRSDMLEASFPRVAPTFEGIAQPFTITPLTLGWVGPCCSELANEDQP